MKRLPGKVKFRKPRCLDCVHYIRQKRRNGFNAHCLIYNRDVPASGTIYPGWCRDRFEMKGDTG